ncbi:hypothetical protein IWX90DRAFT_492002 [Phyllosticta citrichinensis]|uniref:Uncharacterized protein n=1 Tax=Phyllosticta citrichinensis TaxID=1130410 RepID=A0ABR1Y6X9_9PEZI
MWKRGIRHPIFTFVPLAQHSGPFPAGGWATASTDSGIDYIYILGDPPFVASRPLLPLMLPLTNAPDALHKHFKAACASFEHAGSEADNVTDSRQSQCLCEQKPKQRRRARNEIRPRTDEVQQGEEVRPSVLTANVIDWLAFLSRFRHCAPVTNLYDSLAWYNAMANPQTSPGRSDASELSPSPRS